MTPAKSKTNPARSMAKQQPTTLSSISKPSADTEDYFGFVADAANRARAFWQVGRNSLDAHRTYKRDGTKDAEVKKLQAERPADVKWSPEALRVARRFAERCSKPTLERMLREANQRGIEVGHTILSTLFEVTDAEIRDKLWKDCLAAKGWSKSQLEAAIRQCNAPKARRNGTGRTVGKPQNPEDAADKLGQAAAGFERLYLALEGSLHWFNTGQQKQIKAVRRAMAALRERLKD